MIKRYSREQISKIWSDANKFRIWLDIEIAACEAQHKLGNIPLKALRNIKSNSHFKIERISEIEETVKHDVIAFLTNVSEYVGPDSRYIHLGMTSSDILDTALSVQMKQAGRLIIKELLELRKILKAKAKRYKNLLMIGRTHGVHAEPITLGLKFALWYDETNRNIERLRNAVNNISRGKISGAVGTYEHISPYVEKYVCKKLKLRPAKISTQIIQRDSHAEYMGVLAIIASCIEKYSTEVRHLQKTEVLELEESFTAGQKGSSAMPHKKNPVTAEQLSGLARVIRANSIAALENISLWHERDISHSSVERIIIPDSTILTDYILYKFNLLIKNITVYEDNIRKNLEATKGLIFSQNLLLKLIEKGMTRERAYKTVQELAMKCWKEKTDFRKLIENTNKLKDFLTADEVTDIFDYSKSLKYVNNIFRNTGIN